MSCAARMRSSALHAFLRTFLRRTDLLGPFSAAHQRFGDAPYRGAAPPSSNGQGAEFECYHTLELGVGESGDQFVEGQRALSGKLMVARQRIHQAEARVVCSNYVTQMNIRDARQQRAHRIEQFPITTRCMSGVVGDAQIPLFGQPEQSMGAIEGPGGRVCRRTSAVLDRYRELGTTRDFDRAIDCIEPDVTGVLMQ